MCIRALNKAEQTPLAVIRAVNYATAVKRPFMARLWSRAKEPVVSVLSKSAEGDQSIRHREAPKLAVMGPLYTVELHPECDSSISTKLQEAVGGGRRFPDTSGRKRIANGAASDRLEHDMPPTTDLATPRLLEAEKARHEQQKVALRAMLEAEMAAARSKMEEEFLRTIHALQIQQTPSGRQADGRPGSSLHDNGKDHEVFRTMKKKMVCHSLLPHHASCQKLV